MPTSYVQLADKNDLPTGLMLLFLCFRRKVFDLWGVGGLSLKGLIGFSISKIGLLCPSAAPMIRLSGKGDLLWLKRSEMTSGLAASEDIEAGGPDGPGDCFFTWKINIDWVKERRPNELCVRLHTVLPRILSILHQREKDIRTTLKGTFFMVFQNRELFSSATQQGIKGRDFQTM